MGSLLGDDELILRLPSILSISFLLSPSFVTCNIIHSHNDIEMPPSPTSKLAPSPSHLILFHYPNGDHTNHQPHLPLISHLSNLPIDLPPLCHSQQVKSYPRLNAKLWDIEMRFAEDNWIGAGVKRTRGKCMLSDAMEAWWCLLDKDAEEDPNFKIVFQQWKAQIFAPQDWPGLNYLRNAMPEAAHDDASDITTITPRAASPSPSPSNPPRPRPPIPTPPVLSLPAYRIFLPSTSL